MKKSMLRDRLVSLLLNHDLNLLDSIEASVLCDSILDECESAGMLPPFVCNAEICCRNEWEEE